VTINPVDERRITHKAHRTRGPEECLPGSHLPGGGEITCFDEDSHSGSIRDRIRDGA
jgi:hypothetical protein